jgi:hypothetical protein
LKLAKEHDKQSGKWISKTELQKLTKGNIPSTANRSKQLYINNLPEMQLKKPEIPDTP